MMKAVILFPVSLALFLFITAGAHSQNLAELAKREKARQAKILKKGRVLNVGNYELSVITGSKGSSTAEPAETTQIKKAETKTGKEEEGKDKDKKKPKLG